MQFFFFTSWKTSSIKERQIHFMEQLPWSFLFLFLFILILFFYVDRLSDNVKVEVLIGKLFRYFFGFIVMFGRKMLQNSIGFEYMEPVNVNNDKTRQSPNYQNSNQSENNLSFCITCIFLLFILQTYFPDKIRK